MSEDSEFMLKAAEGDQAAFETLMERWEVPVRRFMGRMLQNAAEADDLAQATFVRVWQDRALFKAPTEFRPWLLRAAAELARERLHWWRGRPSVALEPWLEAIGENPPEEPLSEGEIVVRERAKAVQLAVARLPPALREVAVLFEFEGIPQAEIAVIMGRSPKAIEAKLVRARTALRASLANVD